MVLNKEKVIASHNRIGIGKITAPGPPIRTLQMHATSSRINTAIFLQMLYHWLRRNTAWLRLCR
ncbi:hypothetical protein D3C72_1858970 [compost metagenome]